MRVVKMSVVVMFVAALAGCAAFRHDPPSCDGTDRRTLNEGKWDPEYKLGGKPKPCGKAE